MPRSLDTYNPENLPLVLGINAAVGAVWVYLIWTKAVRAVELGQRCEKIRFSTHLSPQECRSKLEGVRDANLLRAKLQDNQWVLRPLTGGGPALPLRKYVYEIRFESGAVILLWDEKRSRGHAVGQKVMRRFLESILG